jgi:probable HAF family extracellular repeat protein
VAARAHARSGHARRTIGFANWLNDAGEVAGTSDLAGDQSFHPFLWNGTKMVDLGTLGGANGTANWVSDTGTVVGAADMPGSQTHHGFLWANGHMRDPPPVDNAPCSNGNAVNNRDQVVGTITDCHGDELSAVLWSNGHAYDLNTLIAPSALRCTNADYINDQGEIVANGVLPNGDQRVVLLIPNPSIPLTAAAPSPVKALHLRTARAAPALARRCTAFRAAVAAKLAACRWKQ